MALARPGPELTQPGEAVAVGPGLVIAFALPGVAQEVPELVPGDEHEQILRRVEALLVPHQPIGSSPGRLRRPWSGGHGIRRRPRKAEPLLDRDHHPAIRPAVVAVDVATPGAGELDVQAQALGEDEAGLRADEGFGAGEGAGVVADLHDGWGSSTWRGAAR